MRQRVSIARAFAVEPEILLCDEPFSSLDEMTARDLRDEFLRLVRQNGKTAVFITHQINEAMEIGDRVLVFHRPARIAYEGRLDAGTQRADEPRDAPRDHGRAGAGPDGGITAVASISTLAPVSSRPATTTALMAGKCRPMTRR